MTEAKEIFVEKNHLNPYYAKTRKKQLAKHNDLIYKIKSLKCQILYTNISNTYYTKKPSAD